MGARVGASAESDMRRFFEGEGVEAVAGVLVLTVRVSLVMPWRWAGMWWDEDTRITVTECNHGHSCRRLR